jgi:hypothetical protein
MVSWGWRGRNPAAKCEECQTCVGISESGVGLVMAANNDDDDSAAHGFFRSSSFGCSSQCPRGVPSYSRFVESELMLIRTIMLTCVNREEP